MSKLHFATVTPPRSPPFSTAAARHEAAHHGALLLAQLCVRHARPDGDGRPQWTGDQSDPRRVDGILLQFSPDEAGEWAARTAAGQAPLRQVTTVFASLNDGRALYAFNDLFIRPRSHVSARYRIEFDSQAEDQISSGLIVSTSAGSTGWLQSIVTGAVRVAAGVTPLDLTPPAAESYRLPWEADELTIAVREPFTSRTSRANIVFDRLDARHPPTVRSHMPENGVIFSDGVEADFLNFNAGMVATIGVAERKTQLVGMGQESKGALGCTPACRHWQFALRPRQC